MRGKLMRLAPLRALATRALATHALAIRVLAILVLSICAPIQAKANPFMGSELRDDGKPSLRAAPVRTGAPDAKLTSRQASLREAIAGYFYEWKDNQSRSVLRGIIVAAFLYGIIHALGPGHRKTVVFSLYLARGAPVWEPATTGLLLALLHGGAAIAILLALRGVSGAISGKADAIGVYMEGGAYALLIVVALALALHAARELIAGKSRHAAGNAGLDTILLTGAYPCPGAILVLILSLTLGITGIGILAVLAMSLGMCVPIVAAGYLAWFGRTGLFLALGRNGKTLSRLSSGFELAGYAFLLCFSVYMAEPFILSLIRGIR